MFSLEHSVIAEYRSCLVPRVLHFTHSSHSLQNRRLIAFQYLAGALIKFDAVAVEWNVATGHHDAWPAMLHCVIGERRRRQRSEVFHCQPRFSDTACHGAQNTSVRSVRTGSEIAGNAHRLAWCDVTDREQVVQEAPRVDVCLQVSDVGDQASESTRAERQL